MKGLFAEKSTLARFLLVVIDRQKLYLIQKGASIWSCTISTGAQGVGQGLGSGQTPLGLHRIHSKIGEGADPYTIFEARLDTGHRAVANEPPFCITTRILRLEGLEEGVNLGKDGRGDTVDSFERYIYIHGTNAENDIGSPVSEGCVRLRPCDMLTLFDGVKEGELVYIAESI